MPSSRTQGDHEGRRRPSKRMPLTLGHPLRRGAVRILNGSSEPVTTDALAQQLCCEPKTMSYHLRVLSEHGAIESTVKPVGRGSLSFSWSSRVKNNPTTNAKLTATSAEDKQFLAERTREQAAA